MTPNPASQAQFDPSDALELLRVARKPSFPRCEGCGAGDASLRAVTFVYTISIVLMTFRNPSGGLLCQRCRRRRAWLCSIGSFLFGWWGIPWGPIYTIGSLSTNLSGGVHSPWVTGKALFALANQLAAEDNEEAIAVMQASIPFLDEKDRLTLQSWLRK